MSTLTLLPSQPRVRRSNSLCLTSLPFFVRKPLSQLSELDDGGHDSCVDVQRRNSQSSTSRLGMYLTSHPSSSASSHKSVMLEESQLLTSNQYETEEEEDDEEEDNNESLRHTELLTMTHAPVTRHHSLGATPPLPVMQLETPLCDLSVAQKKSCFQYIKRRHSIAMHFASLGQEDDEDKKHHSLLTEEERESSRSHWEFVKVKNGVHMYRSRRSRCEIRGVTRVNASVSNVMALFAAQGQETVGSQAFSQAQRIMMGREHVLESRVLASCVPSSVSNPFLHCGLKYMVMKNPFGMTPLDLVLLDYTDVVTVDNKRMGFRILESIRVPECSQQKQQLRKKKKCIRASIRCEVYVVRETSTQGVVEVTFASHLDPKSKYSSSKKRTAWLDHTVTRLCNVRAYVEKASLSHRVVLEPTILQSTDKNKQCVLCERSFSFLTKRHHCRLCGDVSCRKCCRKLPIFVGKETTRVRVCIRCMLESRQQANEQSHTGIATLRRNSIGNRTWIACDQLQECGEDYYSEDDQEDNNQ